jgi:thiamine-phosphate pyrophosphorylase
MSYELYVVTDDRLSLGRSHVEVARLAYEGGADVVQLRAKNADGNDALRWAKEIASIARSHDRLFIVDDRIDIALASGADGVHLGQSDIPAADARRIVPSDFVIGVSVSNVDQAVAAERDGADYVALSPIFDTASKSDAGSGHGLKMMADIKSAVDVPAIAIGGINLANVSDVIAAGADGVAVISAVVSQKDIAAAAHAMREAVIASKARR